MQETRESNGTWALFSGALLLIVIVAGVVWSEYKAYHIGTWVVLCAGGSLFWFIGFALAGRGGPAGTPLQQECAEGPEGSFLSGFYLNGCFFQAYEQGTSSGRKQFRLLATPQISPEREAAMIRYVINEGLSEKMWPQISRRIEEEANWAFFV
jgi:hypothetical protein